MNLDGEGETARPQHGQHWRVVGQNQRREPTNTSAQRDLTELAQQEAAQSNPPPARIDRDVTSAVELPISPS